MCSPVDGDKGCRRGQSACHWSAARPKACSQTTVSEEDPGGGPWEHPVDRFALKEVWSGAVQGKVMNSGDRDLSRWNVNACGHL